LKDIRMCIKRR